MRLVSVNVGRPRTVEWNGRTITTGIFKEPVEGRVWLRALNLDGDRQADASVHGGPDQAVCAYPSEHYAWWREQLPGRQLRWGAFGENFSTQGLLEDTVLIGDRFRIGGAEVEVTKPRMPCRNLAFRFEREDLPKLFLRGWRTGFYLRVVKEGEVGVGDPIEPVARPADSLPVATLARLYAGEEKDPQVLERAARIAALSEGWRRRFRRQLEKR